MRISVLNTGPAVALAVAALVVLGAALGTACFACTEWAARRRRLRRHHRLPADALDDAMERAFGDHALIDVRPPADHDSKAAVAPVHGVVRPTSPVWDRTGRRFDESPALGTITFRY